MVSDREYIINRLKGKKKTIDEFNFDLLDAPPLALFFTPYDIMELNRIATSIKLQAKPQERYRRIDSIMKSKGMRKFGSGTNRVIYFHPDFPNIVFKVAADNIGLNDNPAEYRNQFALKPFVTKTFEISPCGTIAISEKVNPIQSREEFISVADDIFELIVEFFIGKYVVADIGEKFFMNWGVRRGFGPVLLDYPYFYELDGDKLYCAKPDPTSITGTCDGLIDYDAGFNRLVCTKCGAIYKAAELKKNIDQKLIKNEGDRKMKITLKGSKGTRTIGENNTPFTEEAVTVYKTMDVRTNKRPVVKEQPKKEEPVVEDKKEDEEDKFVKFPEKTVNGVVENDKEYISPIVEDKAVQEECKKELEEKKTKKPPVQRIDELVNEILEVADTIGIDIAKDDALIRSINKLYYKISSQEKILKSDFAAEIFEVLPVEPKIEESYIDGEDLVIKFGINIGKDAFLVRDSFTIEKVYSGFESEGSDDEEISKLYEGYIIDHKEVDPSADHKDVIVISEDGGQSFVKKNGRIICVNRLGDKSVNSLAVVSKKWLNKVTEEKQEEVTDEVVDDQVVEETVEETIVEEKVEV